MNINATSLDIVLPVLDEERTIESSIRKLVNFSEEFLINFQWKIMVAVSYTHLRAHETDS